MPTQLTPVHALSWPQPDDAISEGAAVIQAAMQQLDKVLPIGGREVVAVVAGQTNALLTVDMPAGKFTVSPAVVATVVTSGIAYVVAINSTGSATQFVINLYRRDGANFPANANITVQWVAVPNSF